MISLANKVMINQLIEVTTLWGEKKLSIGGRGRCYLDFLDSPHEITPIMIDHAHCHSYGTLADLIVYTGSQEVFKRLYELTRNHHPERLKDTLYLARIIWLCNRKGLKELFNQPIYADLHSELLNLEEMYRQEHKLYKYVACSK